MKTILLILASAVLLCVGPVTAGTTEFIALSDPQPVRKTAPSSPVDRRFALPVYFGWPERAYRVIGYVLVFKDEKVEPTRETALATATAVAQARRADALLIGQVDELERSMSQNGERSVFMSAAAIQWSK